MGKGQLAAENVQGGPRLRIPGQHLVPQGVEGGGLGGGDGGEIDRATLQPVQAEVLGPGHLHHLHPVPDQGDEGQEQLAVDAPGIEGVRRPVGGGDDHHPPLEQGLEQAAEDHGVGNVGDVELVEAQKPRPLGDPIGGGRDGIVALGHAEAGLAGGGVPLPPGLDVRMDAGHEGVEVVPALARHRGGLEEQVHQHGLAPPHRPVEIDPPGWLPPTEGIEAEAGLPPAVQLPLQPGEALHRAGLGGVGGDLAPLQARLVGGADGLRHGGSPGPRPSGLTRARNPGRPHCALRLRQIPPQGKGSVRSPLYS